ncbi:hypothetical protein SDC9_59871 [bioreactor metagenome]|uniref:Uncharacterized protein n=1 Tax=bioreactor metagenome TaxID=1076179 RepID=A0A644XHC0_9ZZZZ
MLEAGSCHGELQSLLPVFIVIQAVEQAAGKAVAAAYPVHDAADFVFFGDVEVLAVVQAGSPVVPVGTVALPQGNGDHVHVGIRGQNLVAQCPVLVPVQRAGFHHHVGGDFQRLLHVLFIGHRHVHVICQLPHDLGGALSVFPKIFAVVQITGDGNAARARGLHALQRQFHGALGDGGSDAGDVKPAHTVKRPVPVDVAGLRQGNGGRGAVIHHLGGKLIRAALQIIDAHAAGAALDAPGIHAEAAQLRRAGVADGAFGQNRQKGGVHAEVGKGHGHVCLAAAEGGLQRRGLEKPFLSGGLQAQHNFTKCQKFHKCYLPVLLLQQMHGEAAEFLLQIYGDHRLALVFCGALVQAEAALCKLRRRPGNAVGAHGDMAVFPQIRGLHHLYGGTGEVGAAALFHSEAKGMLKLAADLQRGVRVPGVDAHVGQLKVQRAAAGLRAQGGDAVKAPGGNIRLVAQPASAHGVNKRSGQILAQILCAHAASGNEPDSSEGAGQGFHGGQSSIDAGREELDDLQPVGHSRHDLGGGDAARGDRHAVFHAPCHDLFAVAGGYDELCSRFHGGFALLQRYHRACAHQHIRAPFRHGGDGVPRGGGAEGDLHDIDASGQHGFRGGNGVSRVLKNHHRNHAGLMQSFQNFHNIAFLSFCGAS